MDAIKLIHDTAGQTLTIWLDDPEKESVVEETADEVVLMKDASGRVIGVEILHFRPASGKARVTLETLRQAAR
ncbi:MAG TPA: DUF2283 domain-containing protein [Anaeromyxobacteraceae bacterium]|jgi:uncharacterized protein YuzE|nr:DUF2283 domain-containing protein [Anaeromyxobacteraceae bacterium]